MADSEPIAPDTSIHEDVEFECHECAASLRWDPTVDALSCEYCGSEIEVPVKSTRIVERPLTGVGDAARGLGLETRVTACDTCGARVSFAGGSTSELCVYCGSPHVLQQDANRNAIRPESLVPLDVSRDEVAVAFRLWLKRLWFRPNALKKTRDFQAVGIYVPYWTFDARAHSSWTADAGHYYYVTEHYWTTVNGKRVMRTRQKRKVRWVPAAGQRDDLYDDELVHASRGRPQKLVQQLGGFDLGQLVPYEPAYLAGWLAEEYQIDLESASGSFHGHVRQSQTSRCAGDIPGDTYRFLSVDTDISEVRWKHILLPIWSLQYRHRGKTFTVLVHGQNGRVVGDAPLSPWKILGLVGVIVGVALIVWIVAVAI